MPWKLWGTIITGKAVSFSILSDQGDIEITIRTDAKQIQGIDILQIFSRDLRLEIPEAAISESTAEEPDIVEAIWPALVLYNSSHEPFINPHQVSCRCNQVTTEPVVTDVAPQEGSWRDRPPLL